jgi:hypothetical protein
MQLYEEFSCIMFERLSENMYNLSARERERERKCYFSTTLVCK